MMVYKTQHNMDPHTSFLRLQPIPAQPGNSYGHFEGRNKKTLILFHGFQGGDFANSPCYVYIMVCTYIFNVYVCGRMDRDVEHFSVQQKM